MGWYCAGGRRAGAAGGGKRGDPLGERERERENERVRTADQEGAGTEGEWCVSRKKIHTIRSGQCIRVNSRDCLGVRVCSDIDTEARSERALINVKKSPIFKPATPAGA